MSIAAINSSKSLTLAGGNAALEAIADTLTDESIFHRFLQVEVPYHSPMMEPLRDALLVALDGLTTHAPVVPLYSTVTGKRWADAERHDGAYWFRNVRDPVLFSSALESLIDDGHTLFAEIGPNPVLTSAIRDGLSAKGAAGDVVYSLRRKDTEATRVRAMLAELYTLGLAPDWRCLNGEASRDLTLPTYRWERSPFWSESAGGRSDRLGVDAHPLLGVPMAVAAGGTWTVDLNGNYLPWLADHTIDDTVVFPGAAYVEACLALHAASDGSDPAIIDDLELTNALTLNPDAGIALQWNFDARTRACTASSRAHGSDAAWQPHATASVRASQPWAAAPVDIGALEARCADAMDPVGVYAALAARGLNYGPAFRCVRALRRGTGEVLATLALGEAEAKTVATYRVHPALLDAALQALIATIPHEAAESALFMPVAIKQILYHAPVGAHARAHCRLVRKTEAAVEGDIRLFDASGAVLLEVKGVRCLAVGRRDGDTRIPLDRWMYEYAWELSEPAVGFADAARWLVFADGGATAPSLRAYLSRQGATAVVEVVPGDSYARLGDDRFQIRRGSPDDMARLLAEAAVFDCQAVIHLWGGDAALNDAVRDPTGLQALDDVTLLVQALVRDAGHSDRVMPRLYVAPRDARHVDPARVVTGLNQASLVGFLRVVAVEHPELRATLVDLDPDMSGAATGRRLGQEVLADSAEDDVALRGPCRHVHRLVRRSESTGRDTLLPVADLDHEPAYRLEIPVPGSIDKVRYREVPRRAPGPNEVELAIRSVGLNFKDVLKVLGVLTKATLDGTYCGETLGMECTAVVTAIGPDVTAYAVGDEVVAMIAGCLGSHVTIDLDRLRAVPRTSGISAQDAATVPVAFMTAYYGLVEAARLRKGETILIHAGAGGVGMAAIQVARWIGATIFATASSPEKRDLLISLGVSRVWDSRSLAFVEGVLEATDGRGVDVVLNSLSGEAMERSFEALAPLGRFVEIGKRDIIEKARLPMTAFDRSASFIALDLDRLSVTHPDLIARLFKDTWERFEAGDFRPLPLTRFPAAKVADAIRFMAQSRHVGKVVIDFDDADDIAILPLARRTDQIRSDATYLVTGAFGGFGQELSKALAARGARHLVLAGRSGANTPAARTMLDDLRKTGVAVREIRIDIADAAAVGRLVDAIAQGMPPLAGVFHAAAVLDDALIANLDRDRMARVMAPKALGALNLHEATKDRPLDLFVLFSSATSLIGNPGQASYVAANATLDALAHQRRAQGLAATAINWGAIGNVGMLAEDSAATRQLERAGVRQIPVADALAVMVRVLDLDPGVMAVMDVDWSAWMSLIPAAKAIPRFAMLAREASSADTGTSYGAALLDLPAAERVPVLTAAIIGLVAEALHVPLDKVDRHQPLSDLGIDSLVGVELQAAIGAKLGIQISLLQLMKGGNIEEMATALLQKLTGSRPADTQRPGTVSATASVAVADEPPGMPVAGELAA